ncbi:MAG: biotin transporter BioY [Bacillota bacterium]|jgi:biotin transport system substrate-specific component
MCLGNTASNLQSNACKKNALTLSALIKASLMCGIIVFLAYVVIPLPFSPVPVTLQSLGVMMAGLALGPALGTWAVLIYLALGFIGLPVFAGGRSGLGALLGPSGGYLLGFLPGAWVTGMLSSRGEQQSHGPAKARLLPVYLVSSMLGGIAVVHTIGVLYLAKTTGMPLSQAMLVGTVPFLPGDIFKSLLASILARKSKDVRKHLRA